MRGKLVSTGIAALLFAACLFLSSCAARPSPSAASSVTPVSWAGFIEKSSAGYPCSSIVALDDTGDSYVTVEYDGNLYHATRSDGQAGSGTRLLVLDGRLPSARSSMTFCIISNNDYTFEEVADDIIGSDSSEDGSDSDYFLVW